MSTVPSARIQPIRGAIVGGAPGAAKEPRGRVPPARTGLDYKDYYQILGVSRDADEKAIKKAFRKLARQYHPDVNPDDPSAEARFKDIAEAYEVLGDPEKRSHYDRLGREWQRHQRTGGAPGGFDWSQWSQAQPNVRYATAEEVEELFGRGGIGGMGGFSDFFDTLFGGAPRGRPRAQPRAQFRGSDIRQPVQITFPESYAGTTRTLSKDGRRIEVTIPPGVHTGSKVRVRGEGAPGAGGGPSGDLYLEIEVLPDPRFERKGNDLFATVAVPLTTAVLGGEALVPTPSGDVRLTIPPETQNGRRFRLSGKGMPSPRSRSQHGDLYVTVEVELPSRLTDEERALFEQLRDLREAG